MSQTAANSSLIAALEAIAHEAPEDGLSLNELLERLGDRAFGVAMFALALPSFIPVVAQIVSIPMIVLAFQMLKGREEPWLPQKMGARRFEKATLRAMANNARRWLGWLERLARPRYQRFAGRWGERVSGGLFLLFAVFILIPLWGTNGVPATGILIAALGLIMSDGILVLAGLTLGSVWIVAFLAILGVGGRAAIDAIIGFLPRLFGG